MALDKQQALDKIYLQIIHKQPNLAKRIVITIFQLQNVSLFHQQALQQQHYYQLPISAQNFKAMILV